MDSRVKLFLQRAENERDLAKALLDLSQNNEIKNELRLTPDHTFYSAVISHSYYCIFYSARAILFKEKIEVNSPEIHRKTVDAFEKLVSDGKLDFNLLTIYKRMIVRADTLLGIFRLEKRKRGEFTYQKLPQANLEPAKESLENAFFFFKNIYNILKESK